MAAAVCQNQFLGSRISLISNSEIRYEGILYALDLCEATISLAKVRSYGTEDRPTERPLPSKDDVFEYIIFRGADIKSIDVVEPPAQGSNASIPGIPSDPAIIDFSHSSGGGHYGNVYKGNRMRANDSRGGPPMYNMGGSGAGSPPHMNHGGSRGRRGADGYQNYPGMPMQMQNGRPNRNNQMGGGGQGGGQGGRQHYGSPGGRMNYGGNFRQGGYHGNNGGQFQQRGRMTTPNRGGNYGQPQRRMSQQGGSGGSMGGGRSQFRTRGMNRASFPPKVSFDGDFDFEKANEELLVTLAQVKLEDETGENKAEGEDATNKDAEDKDVKPAIFYRKDDFFDNISCEALERSKGNIPRVDWKAERKLNAETFGAPNNSGGPNNRQNYQYRNGPRGNAQRMMPHPNMFYAGGPPMNPMWMSPNSYYRNNSNMRRPRMKNN